MSFAQDSFLPNSALKRLAASFPALTLAERLQKVRAAIPGRVVFTTSFGIEDQLLTHEIFSRDLSFEIVTLDTGRLFPETYQVWTETEERYGKKIRAFFPEHDGVEAYVASEGIDGFRHSVAARRACCFVRKVEPLGRALKGADGWITGLRADQSQERSRVDFISREEIHDLIKVNPLLDWSREQVANAVRKDRIPYNPLHDRGFLSIGCAPCTRAVLPGEPERAGRWWWEEEDKKECGLHTAEAAQKRDLARREKIFSHLEPSA